MTWIMRHRRRASRHVLLGLGILLASGGLWALRRRARGTQAGFEGADAVAAYLPDGRPAPLLRVRCGGAEKDVPAPPFPRKLSLYSERRGARLLARARIDDGAGLECSADDDPAKPAEGVGFSAWLFRAFSPPDTEYRSPRRNAYLLTSLRVRCIDPRGCRLLK